MIPDANNPLIEQFFAYKEPWPSNVYKKVISSNLVKFYIDDCGMEVEVTNGDYIYNWGQGFVTAEPEYPEKYKL